MSSQIIAVQTIGIGSAFATAGGIATLSAIDIPILQSQPASRSLPQIRWLFSRGSHIYPTAGTLSTLSFAYLAYAALPTSPSSVSHAFKLLTGGGKSSAYLAAALLTFGIGPFTQFIMVPTNFKLMDRNAEKGGYWSFESAKIAKQRGNASVSDAPYGERNTGEFTDVSGPQSKTEQDSTPAEDREIQQLLGKFASLNYVRSLFMAAGGLVGLLTALTP